MADSIGKRLMHAWNAFVGGGSSSAQPFYGAGQSYGQRPNRAFSRATNERTIMSSLLTRIAVDAANFSIRHVRVNENEQYLEKITSGLSHCLTFSPNIDQTPRAFKQDMVYTMLDKGVIAVVPVDTNLNPKLTGGYDILSMRVGTVVKWMPKHVTVKLYNESTGDMQDITLPKAIVTLVENPFYDVMNQPNSTLERLRSKLNMLDAVDAQASSGKFDMIIQLPYTLKSPQRIEQANNRRKAIEDQLTGSNHGIAYVDATEKITQLNRPVESNLLKQVEYLTGMLYDQLGVTEEIFKGTADEKTTINYHNRTIEPILTAITEAFTMTFLTKTARSQGQRVVFLREPFKLVPVSSMADIADKFTRNEILSSNEIRGLMGFQPSKDPKADELRNKNIPEPEAGPEKEGEIQNGS